MELVSHAKRCLIIAALVILAAAPASAQVWGDHEVRCVRISDIDGATEDCLCAIGGGGPTRTVFLDRNCDQVRNTTTDGAGNLLVEESFDGVTYLRNNYFLNGTEDVCDDPTYGLTCNSVRAGSLCFGHEDETLGVCRYDATVGYEWTIVGGFGVTPTALAANGSNCSAGNYPLGVDASGNAEGCTAAGGGFTDIDTDYGAETVTSLWVFDQGLSVGADLSTSYHLSLYPRSSGLPGARRGGSIEWYSSAGTADAYTFLNNNGEFVLSTAAQSAASDAGNFSVDSATGDTVLGGDLTIGGANFLWSYESASNVGLEWAPTYTQTGGATVGAWPFLLTATGSDDAAGFEDYSRIVTTARDPSAGAAEGELTFMVLGSAHATNPSPLLALVGDTVDSVEIEDGTRLSLDGAIGTAAGTTTTQGDTYLVKNGGDMELWIDGTKEATFDASGTELAGYVDFTDAAAPGNPAAGLSRCYTKTGSSGDLCCRDSAGTETCASSGAGGGFTDIDTDYGPETVTSAWSFTTEIDASGGVDGGSLGFNGGTGSVPLYFNSDTAPTVGTAYAHEFDTSAAAGGTLHIFNWKHNGTQILYMDEQADLYHQHFTTPWKFSSLTSDAGGVPFIFQPSNGASTPPEIMDWVDQGGTTAMRLMATGDLYHGSAASDEFTHEDGTHSITGAWTFEPVATGVHGVYDIEIGSSSRGGIRLGQSGIYSSAFNTGNIDLRGTMVFRQEAAVSGILEFAFLESGNTLRAGIPESAAGNATNFFRSFMIAGPYSSATGDNHFLCDTHTAYNSNIDCNTGSTGADMFIQDDLEVEGTLFTHESIKLDADDVNQLTISATSQTASHTFDFPDDEIADDDIVLGDGAGSFTYAAVPNCPDTGGNHLNYTASTNTLSCGTSSSGGGGGGYAALLGFSAGSGVAAKGTTEYLGFGTGTNTTTEIQAGLYISTAGTVSNLRTYAAPHSSGSCVVTIRKNAASCTNAPSVTHPAGTTGAQSDTASSGCAVVAGDYITIGVTNNASGGGSRNCTVYSAAVELQ